jgi:hypothetical protein
MWCSGLSINRAKNFKKRVSLESESEFFTKKLGKKSCQTCRPLLALVQSHFGPLFDLFAIVPIPSPNPEITPSSDCILRFCCP